MKVKIKNPEPFPGIKGIKLTDKGYLVDKSFKYNGKQRRFRALFAKASEAMAYLEELGAQATLGQLPKQKAEIPTLGHYIDERRKDAKEEGIRSVEDLERILRVIERDFGRDRPMTDFEDKWLIMRWKADLERRPTMKYKRPLGVWSFKTIKHHVRTLTGLIRRAHEDGVIKKLPRVKLKGAENKRVVNLEIWHLPLLINAFPAAPEPWRAMFLTVLYTGMRLEDFRMFEKWRIDGDLITYPSTKNGEPDRTFQAPSMLLKEINALIEHHNSIGKVTPYLFAKRAGSLPFSRTHIRRVWNQVCDGCGIPRTFPHAVRAFAATVGAVETGSDASVQKWGAWKSEDVMKKHYLQADPLVQRVVNGIDEALARTIKQGPFRVIKGKGGDL